MKVNFSSKKSNKFNGIIKYLTMFVMVILCVFTFAGCELYSNPATDSDGADFENGLPRLTNVDLSYNTYFYDSSSNEESAKGNQVTDTTGIFSFELLYYANANSGKDSTYDQSNYYALSTNDSSESGATATIDLVNTDNFFDDDSEKDWDNARANISYPDFLLVVDGITTQIQVDVNFNDFKLNNTYTRNPVVLEENAFTFTYKNPNFDNSKPVQNDPAETNYNPEFIPASKDYITCKPVLDGTNGFRYMVFINPRLGYSGNNTRTIKVKMLPSHKDGTVSRGASIFSSPLPFEAVRLEFDAYSTNSTEMNYLGLVYDDVNLDNNKHYFYEVKKVYSEALGQNVVTKLIGYFPVGRKVEVTRKNLVEADNLNSDYGFQAWTTNTYAENSYYFEHTANTNTDSEHSFSSELFKTNKKNDLKSYIKLLFDSNVPKTTDGFYSVPTYDTTNAEYKYYLKHYTANQDVIIDGDYSTIARLFYDTLNTTPDANNEISSTISVSACSAVNNYVFYANYAKTTDFILSGTIYDGDEFFGTNNTELKNVEVKVFDSSKTEKLSLDRDGTVESTDRTMAIKIQGNYFEATGLEYGDYIIFNKIGTGKDDLGNTLDNLPYTFYSASMNNRVNGENGVIKVLSVAKNEKNYTDRINNSIIGTKYEEDNNLQIDVYITDEHNIQTGNQHLTSTDNANVSVEIIKTTSSYVDTDGYITTNVILSLLVPSSASLIGYNAELNKESEKQLFKNGDDYILHVRPYDFDLNTYSENLYYSITSPTASVIMSPDSKGYLATIDGKEYLFYYNHTADGKLFYNQVNSDVTKDDLFYSLVVDGSNKTIYKYTKLSGVEEVSDDFDTTNNRVIKKIQYNTHTYSLVNTHDEQLNNTIYVQTEGYKTELKYDDEDTSTSEQPVYVYYDVETSKSGKSYLTAPLGKLKTIVDIESSTTSYELVWYYGKFSNLTQPDLPTGKDAYDTVPTIKVNGSENIIMLGKDILSSTNTDAINFREYMGARMLSNYYYYVKALGDKTTIRVSQTMESKVSDEKVTIQVPNYKDGSSSYTGEVVEIDGPDLIVNFDILSEYLPTQDKSITTAFNLGTLDNKVIGSTLNLKTALSNLKITNGSLYSYKFNTSSGITIEIADRSSIINHVNVSNANSSTTSYRTYQLTDVANNTYSVIFRH